MLDAIPADTIEGVVTDAGISGSGLIVDNGTELITVYGMGPLGFWNSIEVLKPAFGDKVEIDTVEVTLSDGTSRLIAVSLTIIVADGEDITVDLRDEDGRPAWRGINKQGGANGTGDCSACPNSKNCGQAQGNGTGICPLTTE
ncbi:MAG: hypothetical protein U9N63_03415 [Pseudomonadota bacterium]|nr:hypothetical protein [Pseudomonadota bacterium]